MEFGVLERKRQQSDTARTAAQAPLAKRQLQWDKPSTSLSSDVLCAQHTTHLPKQRNVELPKK